jgi:hypothetical protein
MKKTNDLIREERRKRRLMGRFKKQKTNKKHDHNISRQCFE